MMRPLLTAVRESLPTLLGWRLHWRHVAGVLLLAALACGLYASLENTDDLPCLIINASLLLVPWALLAALRGKPYLAAAIASLMATFIWEVGESKFRYFGNRLAILDLPFLTEPDNWGIVWRYPLLTWSLIGFLLVAVLLCALGMALDRGHPGIRRRERLGLLLLVLGLCAYIDTHRHAHQWEVFRDDADCGFIKTCGVLSRLVYSVGALDHSTPLPSGDPARFLAASASLAPPPAPELAGQKPDVVLWLNESTFNPRHYKLPNAHLPKLGLFATTALTRAQGLLRVHTFGGKTWLSEFSLLTGLVPDDFGTRRNLVFNGVAPDTQHNIVRLYKAAGYHCVVLMPTAKFFYGAGRTYHALGFDQILTLRDFPEYDNVKGDEWDIADSPRIAEAAAHIVERHRAAHPEQPLLLYFLSIKEHAPYNKRTKPGYGLDHSGITPTLAGRLTDYIDRQKLLDAGLTRLETTLRDPAHPALWLWFGDHQGYFEEPPPPYTFDATEPRNITQFQIRSNYPAHTAEAATPFMDIAFLGSLVADLTAVPQDDYYRALSAMRRSCQGRLDDCEDHALVESYKGYVYSPVIGMLPP